GGLLTAWFSWRMIFLINLPLGVLVFSGVWLLDDKQMPKMKTAAKLDYVGIFLAQGTILTISVLLDVGIYWGWTTSRVFVCWLAAFIVFVSSFIAWSSFSAHPMINFRLLSKRNIALGLGIKIPFSVNLYVLFALLPAYM